MKMSLHIDKIIHYYGYDEKGNGEVLLDEFTLRSIGIAHGTSLTVTVRDGSDEAAYFLNAFEKRHVVEMILQEPVLPGPGERKYREEKTL